MIRRLSNVKSFLVLVIAAFAMAAIACGGQPAAPAPAPAPAQPAIDPAQLSKLVQDAVKESVPEQQAGPAPVSAEEIQSMVEAAVAANAPEGASPEQIQAMVEQAVAASVQPGATKDEIEGLVTKAVSDAAATTQTGVSATEVQQIVAEAVKAIPTQIPVQQVVLQPVAAPAEELEESKVGIFNRPSESNPKRGGIVRTGWPIAVQHFDLHQGAIAYGGMTMMYNNLVYWNAADGERTIIPDLAESWDISPDGLVWTFPLRERCEVARRHGLHFGGCSSDFRPHLQSA